MIIRVYRAPFTTRGGYSRGGGEQQEGQQSGGNEAGEGAFAPRE